ncbi:uncharacterized protein LY89DRAFT_677223 [Mollisia scopiformis]|uniref:Uncharacterized protein n=1 Tax=Mollisia scopiformis TaxID=149040 RepID=A0A132B8P1_MOLSC|nr:uncharacterized protein LY89DRAFT_677223 [Mollisia scopiformis]KUJ08359.1 hypothetical protein LY89DRAFT_677223 [Mollisia scopiformis]
MTKFLLPTLLLTLFLNLAISLPLHKRAACSSAVQNFVNGINDNITVQKQEQAQTKVIQQELAQATPDQDDFQSSKSKLITIVNQGISIRTNNQKIAPSGNAAIAGLATVAKAQQGELKLAQGLTGNPTTDNPNLSKLQTMFSGGIQQNQQNAKD